MSLPTRLWDKGAALDDLVHRFTVGDDPRWDVNLAHWDCLGSAAHAHTLARIGVLSPNELNDLLRGLAEIDTMAAKGDFEIPVELEDIHTAIEAGLTQRCGVTGAKIHAGRSRNDQVATAMRLYMRDASTRWLTVLGEFIAACLERVERDADLPMPGYTHLQPAMPSSASQWLHACAEAALEQSRATLDLLDRLDSCPLGVGAGFGVPLPLDREFTAKLLGFSRAQRSPIDTQNSRGRLEKYFARVASDVGCVLERFAADIVLFASAEFGFVQLPEALTTGSSIMPQKRNPDVAELLRARAARLKSRQIELELLTTRLTSGYHRDLQLTKEPAMRADGDIREMLAVATIVVRDLTFDARRMANAMSSELFATRAALEEIRDGKPFREAYREISADLHAGRFEERVAGRLESWRATDGRADAIAVAATRAEVESLQQRIREHREKIEVAEMLLHAVVTG